jgi:tetratricopeptide (TPR) repeat protein
MNFFAAGFTSVCLAFQLFLTGCGQSHLINKNVISANQTLETAPNNQAASTKNNPSDIEPPPEKTNWYARGLAYEEKNKYLEAIESFDQALKETPGNIQSIYHRGICLYHIDKLEDALTDFSMVLSKNPGDKDAAFHRAVVRVISGDYSNALEDLKIYSDPGTEPSEVTLWKAIANYFLNNKNEAIAGFLKYSQGMADFPEVLIDVSRLLMVGANSKDNRQLVAGLVNKPATEASNPDALEMLALSLLYDGQLKAAIDVQKNATIHSLDNKSAILEKLAVLNLYRSFLSEKENSMSPSQSQERDTHQSKEATPKNPLTHQYSIKIGGYPDAAKALKIAQDFKTRGEPVFTFPLQSGDHRSYEIYYGFYTSDEEIQTVVKELKFRNFKSITPKKTPYTILVLESADPGMIREKTDALIQAGIMPYISNGNTPSNNTQILVGAFISKDDAESVMQLLNLKESGAGVIAR